MPRIDEKTVLVSMSGGVDSSTAAALLKRESLRVIGVFFDLWDGTPNDPAFPSSRGARSNEADARKVASFLGIPFRLLDVRGAFRKEIIDPFVAEYGKGRTPNPCVRCNERIKFRHLLEMANSLGAGFVATGHYARIDPCGKDGRSLLLKGIDTEKDQSYFLCSLRSESLGRILFPLGIYRKSEVKALARELGLPFPNREESQEICFIPGGDYRAFIAQALPPSFTRPGEIVDEEGKTLGRHSGIHSFTVGQRRGIRIPSSKPLYVLEIDPREGRVVVGPRERLCFYGLIAGDLNWTAMDPPVRPFQAMARVRYRHREAEAIVSPLEEGRVLVTFRDPQRSVAPGQAVAFYQGDRVLGGGWIERGIRN